MDSNVCPTNCLSYNHKHITRGYIMSEEQLETLFPDMYGDEDLSESMQIISG